MKFFELKKNHFSIKDFEIIRKIGEGKFSEVFLAREKKMNFLVALKKMNKQKIRQYSSEKLIV